MDYISRNGLKRAWYGKFKFPKENKTGTEHLNEAKGTPSHFAEAGAATACNVL